ARIDEALLESVRQKSGDGLAVKEAFFEACAAQLVEVARALAEVFENGGEPFTEGEGGWRVGAGAMRVRVPPPVTAGRPALPAVTLAADIAMISAVGNDVGFDHVFVRQLIAQARRGDALIGVSTSGNSGNLLAAFARAKELGLATIGLAGGGGG